MRIFKFIVATVVYYLAIVGACAGFSYVYGEVCDKIYE